MSVTIIGGTYYEIDLDDHSYELYGSGFRGAKFFLENIVPVKFYTTGNDVTKKFLKENQKVYRDFSFECKEYPDVINFKYNFSLDTPSVFPNLKVITRNEIQVESENIVAYGMLESDIIVKGKKVVYDPQTSFNAKRFHQFGNAEQLVYIVNINEAQSLSNSKDPVEIKKYFFNIEKAKALIIKNGPFGATLYYDNNVIQIPSFITNMVYKLGSGDIFTASFSYYWMIKNLSFEESALNASKSTAYYCDKKVFVDCTVLSDFEYNEFNTTDVSEKQVYLASPFFSLAELILIDKIRTAFASFKVKVFSPFHDIGFGTDITIASKDLEGIERSDIIFCVLDNLDSGTMAEAGYSLARGKKIIGYHRTSDERKLLMLEPGNYRVFNHLTTAIYQTIWNL